MRSIAYHGGFAMLTFARLLDALAAFAAANHNDP